MIVSRKLKKLIHLYFFNGLNFLKVKHKRSTSVKMQGFFTPRLQTSYGSIYSREGVDPLVRSNYGAATKTVEIEISFQKSLRGTCHLATPN